MRPRVVARAVLGLAVATSVVVAAAIALRTLAVRRAEEGPQAAAPAPREWARPEPAAMARRLAESLRFRTVSAEPGGERELAALQRHLLEVFPRAARELAPDSSGRGLVFTWPGTDPDRKPLLLLGHLDVVGEGAAGARAWARPPFAGVIDGGYVWGRGAIDDKGPSLAMLEAAEALLAEGFRPRRTIVIALGSDEEVGGTRGAAAIAKEMGSRGVRFGAALDEGMCPTRGVLRDLGDRTLALIGVAEKGYVTLELSADASGGHASMPPERTAVGIVAGALDRLQRSPFPLRATRTVRHMLEALAPEVPLAQRVAFANQWLFGPLILERLAAAPTTAALVRTTLAPTVFESVGAENALPLRARAVVNFRLLPGDSVDAVLAHVRAAVDDERVAIRSLPHALLLERHDLETIHGVDERVSVEAYARAVDFYATYLALLVYAAMMAVAVLVLLGVRALGTGLEAPAAGHPRATGGHAPVQLEVLFHVLLALLVITVTSHALGALFRHLRQPRVIGEVIAGIALGPSLLGRVAPEAAHYLLPSSTAPLLGILAQLGVILFMFLVGLELDTALLGKVDVEVLEGSVLVTQAGDARDYVLGAGDRGRFGRRQVAVMTFSPSRLRIRTALGPPRDAERGSDLARGPCARSPSAADAHEGPRRSFDGAADRG